MTRTGFLGELQDALADRFLVDLVDEHTVGVQAPDGDRFLLDVAVDEPGYEREDPETGAPLPAGVVGFAVRGRSVGGRS